MVAYTEQPVSCIINSCSVLHSMLNLRFYTNLLLSQTLVSFTGVNLLYFASGSMKTGQTILSCANNLKTGRPRTAAKNTMQSKILAEDKIIDTSNNKISKNKELRTVLLHVLYI